MISAAPCDRRTKRPSNRPAMQIYRPPGLRSGEDAANTKPSATAGAKQLKKEIKRHSEENNNNGSNENGKCLISSTNNNNNNTSNGCIRKNTDETDGSLTRADSSLSNDSSHSSQRSGSRNSQISSPKVSTMNGIGVRGTNERIKKEGTPHIKGTIKESKRKILTQKEIDELSANLRNLQLSKENSIIEQFISSNFEGEDIGGTVGQMLVQYSIEENRQAGKAVARIAAQLLDSGAARIFHQGTVTALIHYFDCRDRLRNDHFRVWIAFLNFVSDLYVNIGYTYEGELVNLVFRIFDYMLKAPVLETLKIEELESLIACLLSVGYDLERQCPEQLAILKDLIRDAFIEVQEPWARKMILLLMELGASGWKLPPEANEYYFQHTNS